MTTATLEYRVYGLPIESKSYDMNEDGTLTIIGVASTTNKDYANEIVSPEVLKSLAKQAVGINIYRDHNRHYEGGIGAVIEAWVEDDQLWIKGTILSEYAQGIKERLDIGMNFGFSISGFPKKQRTPEGLLIVDYDLKDITLTYIPINWDTYGTVEYKSQNLIASNCLTGACYHAITNDDGETMENKDNDIIEDKVPEEPVEDKDMNNDNAGLSDAQLAQVKDLINESNTEVEGRILESIEPKLEPLAQAAADKAAEKVANRIIAEFKASQEINEKSLTEEDDEVEEPVENDDVIETETSPEEESGDVEVDDEKSEAGMSEPTTGKPEDKEDEDDEEEVLEEKSLDEKIHDEIVKQLNEKSNSSNFGKFKQSQILETPVMEEKSQKRDVYGRNLKYV
jgi:hypothetical protein